MRTLLPRPHGRADARTLSAAHNGGPVRSTNACADVGSVCNTDTCAYYRPDFWPFGRAVTAIVALSDEWTSWRARSGSKFATGAVADDA